MCELFGFTGHEAENLCPMLREFFSHSVHHPNGWGMAILDGVEPEIEKEPVCADSSSRLADLLQREICSRMLLGHIRRATIGSISWKNCHPYTRQDASGRTWTLIHNGTIFDFPALRPFYALSDSETDSACILAYLVSRINMQLLASGGGLTDKQRFSVLENAVREMAPGNKLNLLIYDGALLYVHTNMAGTLYHRQTVSGTVFATVPLDDARWDPVPMSRLLAYRDGQCVLEGACHGQEYRETAAQRELLALNYVVY